MTNYRCGLAAALSCCALLWAVPAPAAPAKTDAGAQTAEKMELMVVARSSERSSRRSSRRSRSRRAAPAPAVIPIPRPKPDSAQAGAAPSDAPAPADTAAPSSETPANAPESQPQQAARKPVLPSSPAAARTELRALYTVSVLSQRCNFSLSTREGAVLDDWVGRLETMLKLDTQQADALYSDVDLTLYGKGGGKICQRDGAEAKAFRETLDRLVAR